MLDVDMEPVSSDEYDPGDLNLEVTPARMANATMGQGLNVIPHIKLSETSDLKEFRGRYLDEDRARSWVTTVKTTFARDHAKSVLSSEEC